MLKSIITTLISTDENENETKVCLTHDCWIEKFFEKFLQKKWKDQEEECVEKKFFKVTTKILT